MNTKKIIYGISALVVIAVAAYGIYMYRTIFASNTKFAESEIYVTVPTASSYEQVKTAMAPFVEDLDKFDQVAQKKSYPARKDKAGRFLIKKGMNSNEIVNALRQNIPVKLAFNNQERLENFAGRIGAQLEADSLSVLNACLDPQFLADNGLNKNNVLSIFIPNSYEFFWNTSAEVFRDKMLKEYRRFWTSARLEKAKKLNLNPEEVIALASIVHKETVKADERPVVAGVYLNRLQKGIKLEADPTVIYAVKAVSNDFNQVIKRVLYKDLETNSLYNTYKYNGLPPGPIAMPDISAIDAVLNPAKHNYIYFCASVTRFGYHEFAVTPDQHEANRRKYVAWVSNQGIKR
ncbi:MAG: endolytic transglycosylase MltG [Flavobacterium sp.]|nr:endolytic transglycosylase MltG [Flavobacterium sp.]